MLKKLIRIIKQCIVIQIPIGKPIMLIPGQKVSLLQNFGLSCVILKNGKALFISNENKRGLNKTYNIFTDIYRNRFFNYLNYTFIWAQLKLIHDPEIHINLAALGLFYNISYKKKGTRFFLFIK